MILAQTIDSFYRNRALYHTEFGVDLEQIKSLTGAIGQLRYELTTNKPLTLLSSIIPGCPDDLEVWNTLLRQKGVTLSRLDNFSPNDAHPTWFSVPWLFTECYLYRRIMDSVSLHGLPTFDPFVLKKRDGLFNSPSFVFQMLLFLSLEKKSCEPSALQSLFETFVQTSLWANEFDLSLQCKEDYTMPVVVDHLRTHILSLSKRLVVNDLSALWQLWPRPFTQGECSSSHITAIVLDNAGPELVADLCLAEFLLQRQLTDRVHFYPKCIPWYVSDVTPADIDWLLNTGLTAASPTEALTDLAADWSRRWRDRFDKGEFCVRKSSFWTLPCSFGSLPALDNALYDELAMGDVKVIFFKGDLNYRKILADRAWVPDSVESKVSAFNCMQWGQPKDCECRSDVVERKVGDPFLHSCLGYHAPLLVALRIAKSDVAVGLDTEILERLVADTEDWWTIGRYGFIQIISPIFLP